MYVSKYYTCEEIDQRLLQGYYDDFVKAGFGGTINEFWAFVLSIKNKVDKKEGYDLSKNDFTDERFHHEIYLSDPRKTAPEKCKTVIRHPIKKA